MSRTLFGAAAFGVVILGAPAFANAGLSLVADLSTANTLPDISNWAMVSLGFASIGFAGSRKRKDSRIAV